MKSLSGERLLFLVRGGSFFFFCGDSHGALWAVHAGKYLVATRKITLYY